MTTQHVTTQPSAGPVTNTRPALLGLLAVTAVLYLWGLGASGFANEYYAAAVQAGTQSWSAWFFGGLDAGRAITVDKPPASLWVMGLSARLFGFGPWSLLVPQALMGVGAVALLYAAVRRWHGHAAGLCAGAVFALTPVAVLMFRFDNPDALLVLLLVAAAYCLVRACETASTPWLALAGAAVGFGFLTKMLQAFLVLPAFVLVYLLIAPTPLRRRIGQLLVAAAAVVATAGWWVAAVAVWPVAARPYIGGSTTNSVVELALGYNGLARLVSEDAGRQSGDAGPGRLFGAGVGEQVAWLLPAALLALAIGLVLTPRAPRTDRTRAGLVLWGGWLVVTGLVFSVMGGKFHPYYTVALAPAIGAVVAITGGMLWQRRSSWTGRGGLALLTAAAGTWGFLLFAPGWHPELRYALAVVTVAAIALLLIGRTRIGVAAALVGALLGPAAYAVATAATPHTGADPAAGPAIARDGAKRGPGGAAVDPQVVAALSATTTRWAAATSGAQSAAPLELASGRPVIGIGGFTGLDPAPTLAQFREYVAAGQISYFVPGGIEDGKSRPGGGSEITAWVTANFPPVAFGATTVYDLTGGSR